MFGGLKKWFIKLYAYKEMSHNTYPEDITVDECIKEFFESGTPMLTAADEYRAIYTNGGAQLTIWTANCWFAFASGGSLQQAGEGRGINVRYEWDRVMPSLGVRVSLRERLFADGFEKHGNRLVIAKEVASIVNELRDGPIKQKV